MNCLSSIISDVKERAWVHHIPRLMVLSNIANLAGVSPQAILDWMRSVFIDATDWVMVPNVIGMGMHADGGKMMTKPYISGGAYISKMSDYCISCKFDPKLRTGETACPFTTLYWDYLDRNKSHFAKNHRMFQQMNGLKRLSDLRFDFRKVIIRCAIKAGDSRIFKAKSCREFAGSFSSSYKRFSSRHTKSSNSCRQIARYLFG
jgi:deoxyribodipyrimidine photolyase-related protein